MDIFRAIPWYLWLAIVLVVAGIFIPGTLGWIIWGTGVAICVVSTVDQYRNGRL